MTGSLVLLLSLVGLDGLPEVRLLLEGCPQVRSAELTRQLRLELGEGLLVQQVEAPVAATPAALSVTLRCKAAGWDFEVDDPLTGKHLSRRVPPPVSSVERAAAVAASQLVVASWMEFLARRDTKNATPAALAAQRVAMRQVDPEVVAEAPKRPATAALSVEVSAVGRLRQDAGGLLSVGPAARVSLQLSRLELSVGVQLELGRYSTIAGAVDARVLLASLDAGFPLWVPSSWASVWLSLRGLLGSTRLSGASAPAGAVEAFQGEAALRVGPRLAVGVFSVRPSVELGVSFAAPRGLVPDGFVQPLGSFVAVVLGAAWTSGPL